MASPAEDANWAPLVGQDAINFIRDYQAVFEMAMQCSGLEAGWYLLYNYVFEQAIKRTRSKAGEEEFCCVWPQMPVTAPKHFAALDDQHESISAAPRRNTRTTDTGPTESLTDSQLDRIDEIAEGISFMTVSSASMTETFELHNKDSTRYPDFGIKLVRRDSIIVNNSALGGFNFKPSAIRRHSLALVVEIKPIPYKILEDLSQWSGNFNSRQSHKIKTLIEVVIDDMLQQVYEQMQHTFMEGTQDRIFHTSTVGPFCITRIFHRQHFQDKGFLPRTTSNSKLPAGAEWKTISASKPHLYHVVDPGASDFSKMFKTNWTNACMNGRNVPQ